MDFSFLSDYSYYFLTGTVNTVLIAFLTVIFGVVIGTLLALMKISSNGIFKFIASAYIEFIRGTPILVQALIFFYLIQIPDFKLFGLEMARFIPGVIALSINSGAYVAEIIRAGIQAVDRGQMEASRSLGFTSGQSMRYIIIPQAIKNILPALGNEFIVVIKESSILSVIGIVELMRSADIVKSAIYRPFEPLLVAAVIYFILTFTLSRVLGIAERRMHTGD
ncbi:amino acid ABC transporter permease [Ruminiclostridium cellobioparum]|uniref:Amine acid ABC transporter, permease protein, 3-TM region, His/Glu/Gln/Arg/opine family n=1 Tax=Ruminiclostridium cellobioparum subsp. termitidis CT1112 TaxID=1195236 RepID=S0FPN4_RUMCE|nr:amino acid ABC transporter permease [Ruminiclostridium cellobioparum]EMS74185.1 amine acid ABC transporter, permease protein, 3-TM region, His/Glu/Gln/Arg/opine family [Ruminiclostridium cellobioparum subsp. termitidis CT1112]